jgi:hypothetical protein
MRRLRLRIWAKNGDVRATVQVGKFPAIDATGIFKDGDMLVLTISHEAQPGMRENGASIWAVISLIREGDTIKTAQMLERSQTIKRGVGKKTAGLIGVPTSSSQSQWRLAARRRK